MSTDPAVTTAVAYLRTALSHDTPADMNAIRRYADEHGYRLAEVLALDRHTPDPTLRLIRTLHHHQASAVIVPALAHINSIRRTVTERWDLIAVDQRQTWNRGHQWTP